MKHASLQNVPELMTEKNATALANRIMGFWHRQGALQVRAWTEPATISDIKVAWPSKIWVVRSNLVNGQPLKISITGRGPQELLNCCDVDAGTGCSQKEKMDSVA